MQTSTLLIQATAGQATPAPAAPAAEAAPASQARVTVQIPGVPSTQRELQALMQQRSNFSSQLTSAARRREELADQLREADPAARAGLEARIELLDARILQLEQDIDQAGRQIALAPMNIASSSTGSPTMFQGLSSGQMTGISIVFIIFVLAPLAMALARLVTRRATRPHVPPVTVEAAQRLERLEQAVDTVAVEVERISEGQRFVTRLLTDAGGASAIAAGRGEPVRVGQGSGTDER